MVKIGAALAALAVLILLAIELWPGAHRAEVLPAGKPAVQPLSRSAVRKCTRRVLNDWVRESRIGAGYPHQCYRAALDMVSRPKTNCTTAYTIPALCDALKERLQARG